MKSEFKTGRPGTALIGTLLILLSFYLGSIRLSVWSNIALFFGCFLFGAVFNSIRQENKQNKQ